MFIIFLKFSENKASAPQFMDGHNAWIRRGLDDGIFLLVGTLQSKAGGAVLAHGLSREGIEDRVRQDPFVAENVVTAEIHEVTPARADGRLSFLLPDTTPVS